MSTLPMKGSVMELLYAEGRTLEDIARMADVSEHSARKYLYGERAIKDKVAYAMVREWGDSGKRIVGAMDRAREEYLETHPSRPGDNRRISSRARPSKIAKNLPSGPEYDRLAEARAEDDGTRIPIDEWKRLYGEPGSGADVHGRMNGFFASEPDYCE